jgi:hypothetical protein
MLHVLQLSAAVDVPVSAFFTASGSLIIASGSLLISSAFRFRVFFCKILSIYFSLRQTFHTETERDADDGERPSV